MQDFATSCPNYQYVPAILPPSKRVIAIGDIHGDYELAKSVMKLAGLIDDNLEWIGGSGVIVVQVGDQLDSWRPGLSTVSSGDRDADVPEDVRVMLFFDEMAEKARQHNSAVYSLLGNHELMNSKGNFRYVDPNDAVSFDRKAAFKPGSALSKHIGCTRLSALIIGQTLFIHGGLVSQTANELIGNDVETKLKYLNRTVRRWLVNNESSAYIDTLTSDKGDSPFWTRKFGFIKPGERLDGQACQILKDSLQTFNVGRMVIGHTVQPRINSTCDNKLFRIDGGYSKAFVGTSAIERKKPQVLEILGDQDIHIIM